LSRFEAENLLRYSFLKAGSDIKFDLVHNSKALK